MIVAAASTRPTRANVPPLIPGDADDPNRGRSTTSHLAGWTIREASRGRKRLGRPQRTASRLLAESQDFLTLGGDDRWMDDRQVASARDMRVLVVDDEPSIVDVISTALRYQGFGVEAAGSGQEALDQVRRWRPHVMVLDVMLPDMSGFEVAERLKAERSAVPILFLSARDKTADKVRGLTIGGDDYVTKPFSLEEVIARLRSILRRSGALLESSSRLRFEDLELDESTLEVSRGGRWIELTPTEFRLLRYLMLNPRTVLERQQLLDHVWSYDFGGDGRVLETYISYLRKKVDAGGPPLLHTVRGVGYTLRLPR